jgi:lantibiotic transport system permease protein
MKGFILSLRSEFYKSRKTLGFWAAILLPVIIISLVFLGFYAESHKLSKAPGSILWMQFSGAILNVMGALLLPMFVIFIGYSVNSIEHRADTWKTLFSLPISKWAVYSAKFFYALSLLFLSLFLFALITIILGNLLGVLKPELKFADYEGEAILFSVYLKLFLAALGIFSVQFLLSLLWTDFLKPMGVGFVCTIAGVIFASAGWKYAYLIVYSSPVLALEKLAPRIQKGVTPHIVIDFFTKDTYVSLVVFAAVFIAGFYIVQKKSVK